MSITDITVVITSFKSDEKIINCLNSINNQCKVIVVENSDDLKIKKKIENYRSKLRARKSIFSKKSAMCNWDCARN